jgi:hypothetical protein
MLIVYVTRMKWLGAALSLLLLGAQAAPGGTADVRTPDGQRLATATFTQAPDAVLIAIAFANRTALVGTHPVQIHSGTCSDTSSLLSISLPDLVISPAGVSVYNLSTPTGATLGMLNGKSLGIYDAAGQRIACGLIQLSPAASDAISTVAIGVLGGLLIAGGIVLRHGA